MLTQAMERREGATRDIPASFDILTVDGANGTVAAGTPGLAGDWYRLHLIDGTFYNTASVRVNGASKNLSTLNSGFPQGTIIHGKFGFIALASGTVIAYKD